MRYDPDYQDYYLRLEPRELDEINSWEKSQGNLVFLQDCLTLSLALSMYKSYDTNEYTKMGQLVYKAKYGDDAEAVDELVVSAKSAIDFISIYKESDLICSVPKDLKKSSICQQR